MPQEHQPDCIYDGYKLSRCPDCERLISAYMRGREDAATAVLDIMCHEQCDYKRCEALTEAWNAVKGGEQG